MTGGAKIIQFPGAKQGKNENSSAPLTPEDSKREAPSEHDPDGAFLIQKPVKQKRDAKSKKKTKPGSYSSFQSKKPDEKKIARKRARKRDKVLREIERIKDKIETQGESSLSRWEADFLDSLEERLDTYDAAFRDPQKGVYGEALSFRQNAKLKEIKAETSKKDKG